MEVRTESFLGSDKVIVGNKYTDLVLETLGKVYIKTGNNSRVLSDVLELLDKVGGSEAGQRTIFVNSVLEMEEMDYPGDGWFIYNTLNTTLYLSYDERYIALIEAAEGADQGYVRRKGDTMTGQLEINTVAAPLIVASSKLVRNLNAEYLGGYSYEELAKKRVDEYIAGNWTFKGKGTSENNWVFKQNVRMYGDLVTSNSLTSPEFASGFGGYGWRLDADTNTLTIDYLVVRKAMLVYELVINKISATNGSLWISNSSKCESAYLPIILNLSALSGVGTWTGSQENKDAMLRLISDGLYYLPVVPSNIESEVTLTKELSKPSTVNTTPKTFINYKFVIYVKDADKLVSSPAFLGPQSLYDETLLTKPYSLQTGSFSEDDFNTLRQSLILYYITKEYVVTKWSEDNKPLEYTYTDSINKDISFIIIPKNTEAATDYETNGLNSKSLIEIKTFYKYFALEKSIMDTAIGLANESVNSGLKLSTVVPNLWIVNTDSEEYPTLKSGDILRCQKFSEGNIKYYDALVTNLIESRTYIVMKATSVFDIYTELEYDDEGNLIHSEEKYNNTQYNKTELSYSSSSGKMEPSSTSKTEEDRLDDIVEGDDMVLMGNILNTGRLSAIYLTSTDDQGPYIDVIGGLNRPDYSVLYDFPIYEKVKAFIKKKGTIYYKGEADDYYYQTVNPNYINALEKPSYITKNTKEYPLVFVKKTEKPKEDPKDEPEYIYEVLINDGETTEITSEILQNPSKFGYFITEYPTIYSTLRKGEDKKYKHSLAKGTRVRLGNLEGINSEVFGSHLPYGFGLYGENVFLTGEFYLSTGQSVVLFNKDYADFLFGDLEGKYTLLTIDIDGIKATVNDNKGNIASLLVLADKILATVNKVGYIDENGDFHPSESSGFITKSNFNLIFSAIYDEDNNVVNAATICTAINEDGDSAVYISADKIHFQGSAIFKSAVAELTGITRIEGGSIYTNKLEVRSGAKIGGFVISDNLLTWDHYTYGGDKGGLLLGFASIFPNNRFGWNCYLKSVVSSPYVIPIASFTIGNGAAIYASTNSEKSAISPSEGLRYAGFFDGSIVVTESIYGRYWAAPDNEKPGNNDRGFPGVSFNAKDFDLDSIRLLVRDGLIIGVTDDNGRPYTFEEDSYGRRWKA